ncbi:MULTISPECIES: hypothetical protein [Pantoea]|uniref:hypothetical protein n=1 Tax=Pantoea TaxID=53335 RepID=UPI001654C13B|nr:MULTISPECIES: hypothetical protein [Pantoea]
MTINRLCTERRGTLLIALVLLAGIGTGHAEEQLVTGGLDGRTLSWITTTEDQAGVFRIDCIDGYSLFASLVLMRGSLMPSSTAVAGTLAIQSVWITGSNAVASVNSIYAMTPAGLIRQAGTGTGRKLQFDINDTGARRISFGTEKLDEFIRQAPVPCR